MFMGFETSGGGTYGFAFKASVLEGVGVDINRVEGTIAYVNSLISSASLGETFVEQKQTQVLGGRQATMLASTPAPAPSVYASNPAAPMPTPAVQPVAVQPPAPVPAPAQAVTQAVQASPQAPPAQTPAPAQQPAPPAAPPANQPQGDTASPWPPV